MVEPNKNTTWTDDEMQLIQQALTNKNISLTPLYKRHTEGAVVAKISRIRRALKKGNPLPKERTVGWLPKKKGTENE